MIVCVAASPNALISATARASLPPSAKVEWQWRMRTAMSPYAAARGGGLGRLGSRVGDVDDVLPGAVGLLAPDCDGAEMLTDGLAVRAVDDDRGALDQIAHVARGGDARFLRLPGDAEAGGLHALLEIGADCRPAAQRRLAGLDDQGIVAPIIEDGVDIAGPGRPRPGPAGLHQALFLRSRI